jgi:hypothetical protein
MKIAFVGDSFCMSVGRDAPTGFCQEDWPCLVAKKLNANIIQKGHGGEHFYAPVIDFLPRMLEADVTVFCVSEPYRSINKYSLPINMTWVQQLSAKEGNHWTTRQALADKHNIPLNKMLEIAKAADGYYKYLFNQSSVELLQVGLVSFIDSLMKQHNKKAIWFPSFKQSLKLPIEYWGPYNPDDPEYINPYVKVTGKQFIPISGPTANIALHELSIAELKHEGLSQGKIQQLINNDTRLNHLNEENNHKMAELVLNIINKDDFTPREIKMEEYFLT